jgi:hypothetical protein
VVATWRCFEIAASQPARVTLAWHAAGPNQDVEITFDVGRSVRVYVMTDRWTLRARRLGSADAVVSYTISDVPGPVQTFLQQSVTLAAGSYDSDTGSELDPPWFASRVWLDVASGGTAAMTFYSGSDAVAEHAASAWPVQGVPLAGITRLTATVASASARVVWLLEL